MSTSPVQTRSREPEQADRPQQQAERRVRDLDWNAIEARLGAEGYAVIASLLEPDACRALRASYTTDALFRSRVIMARHGFGRGEYRYFTYPLPESVASLRAALYPPLARIANRWSTLLQQEAPFPPDHATFLRHCHEAGQTKPTPLLLQYGAGDYNCLHQDLYGDIVFPLQATVLLSDPEKDFTGGEFVLTEQRPRMQSRASVVPLRLGDAVIFAVHHRPVQGTRGFHRVNLRHGVSLVRGGSRHTLGIILHDAR